MLQSSCKMPFWFLTITEVRVPETTVIGKKPICFLFGFVSLNSFFLRAVLKDSLVLTLWLNLIITVPMNNLEKQKSNCGTFCIDLVKQEYKQVGEHKLLRMILLSVAEYYLLPARATSIDSSLGFVKNQLVKLTLETKIERKSHQTNDFSFRTRAHHLPEQGGSPYSQGDNWGAEFTGRCCRSCPFSTCWRQKIAVSKNFKC